MTVIKYRDPGTGNWVEIPELRIVVPTPPPEPDPDPGVRPGTLTGQTISTDPLTITTPGTSYTGVQFTGRVRVDTTGVSFTDCLFSGPPAWPADSAMLLVYAGASATLTHCTLSPAQPAPTVDGVRGGNFTLSRCLIERTVDGVHIYRDDATVQDSLIRELIYYTAAEGAGQADGTHNDGVQVLAGARISITGNTFEGPANPAGSRGYTGIQVTQGQGPVSDLVIVGNTWLHPSTGAAVNINQAGVAATIKRITLTGNRFLKGAQNIQMIASGATIDDGQITLSGNTWTDNSQPPPVLQRGT